MDEDRKTPSTPPSEAATRAELLEIATEVGSVKIEIEEALEAVPPEVQRLQEAARRSGLAAERLTRTARRVRGASQQRIPAQPDTKPDEEPKP